MGNKCSTERNIKFSYELQGESGLTPSFILTSQVISPSIHCQRRLAVRIILQNPSYHDKNVFRGQFYNKRRSRNWLWSAQFRIGVWPVWLSIWINGLIQTNFLSDGYLQRNELRSFLVLATSENKKNNFLSHFLASRALNTNWFHLLPFFH